MALMAMAKQTEGRSRGTSFFFDVGSISTPITLVPTMGCFSLGG
jgi:hypothetical protein